MKVKRMPLKANLIDGSPEKGNKKEECEREGRGRY